MNTTNTQCDKTNFELIDSGAPWIGKIPKHWKVVPNKYCFQLQRDIVGARVDQYERLALTMNGVIKRSKEDNEGLQPTDFAGYQILRENQLVFKLIDLSNISTSRVGLSPYVGIVSPAYIVLQCNDKINERYAKHFFFMMYYGQIFNSLADNGVRANLGSRDLLNLPIIVPPLSEQIKIADYLDHQCGLTDDIILNLTNKIDALDQYKKSLIKEKVTTGFNNDDLIESGVSWIGKIPEHWRMIPNKYLFIETTRKVGSKWDSYQLLSLTTEGVKEKDIEQTGGKIPESYNKYLIIKEGQMIFCLFDLDVSAVFSGLSPYNGMITSAYNAYNVNESIADKRYIKYFFDFVFTNRSYKYYSKNLRYSVSADQFKNIKTLVPPLSEQTEIADYLDKKCELIDEIKNDIEKEIEILKKYKKSLIFEYVTGKKVVSNEQDSI